jgi:hypothetical protein
VIAREGKWRERKVQEAVEIMNGGSDVITAPSFVLNPIWLSWIKSRYKILEKQSPIRRSIGQSSRHSFSPENTRNLSDCLRGG